MFSEKFFKFYFAITLILALALATTVGCVAYHFIHKYW